jgi:hypothetical protein
MLVALVEPFLPTPVAAVVLGGLMGSGRSEAMARALRRVAAVETVVVPAAVRLARLKVVLAAIMPLVPAGALDQHLR